MTLTRKPCCGCGETHKLSQSGLCATCTWILAMKGDTVKLAEKNFEQAKTIETLTIRIDDCTEKMGAMVLKSLLNASQSEQKNMVSRNTKMRHQWYETKAKLNDERQKLIKAYRKIQTLESVDV